MWLYNAFGARSHIKWGHDILLIFPQFLSSKSRVLSSLFLSPAHIQPSLARMETAYSNACERTLSYRERRPGDDWNNWKHEHCTRKVLGRFRVYLQPTCTMEMDKMCVQNFAMKKCWYRRRNNKLNIKRCWRSKFEPSVQAPHTPHGSRRTRIHKKTCVQK